MVTDYIPRSLQTVMLSPIHIKLSNNLCFVPKIQFDLKFPSCLTHAVGLNLVYYCLVSLMYTTYMGLQFLPGQMFTLLI